MSGWLHVTGALRRCMHVYRMQGWTPAIACWGLGGFTTGSWSCRFLFVFTTLLAHFSTFLSGLLVRGWPIPRSSRCFWKWNGGRTGGGRFKGTGRGGYGCSFCTWSEKAYERHENTEMGMDGMDSLYIGMGIRSRYGILGVGMQVFVPNYGHTSLRPLGECAIGGALDGAWCVCGMTE